jgi:hypothetical protein
MAIDLFKTGTEALPTSSEVLSGTEIPEWVSAGGKQLFEQAIELAQQDYPQYTGDRVATYDNINMLSGPIPEGSPMAGQGFNTYEEYYAANPDAVPVPSKLTEAEQRAEGILTGPRSDSYQAFVDEAADVSRSLGGGYEGMTAEELIGDPIDPGTFTLDDAQPYLDIYQASQDESIRQLERQREQERNRRAAEASMRGAFGGSRLEIGDAVGSAEYAAQMADLRAQAGAKGLEFGAGRFDADRAARLEQAQLDREARFGAEKAGLTAYETEEASRRAKADQLQSFAPLIQGLQEQEASGMLTAGQAKRELDQMALDMAYADYVSQTDYPMSMVNFAVGVLKGIPYDSRQFGLESGQKYVETPSIYGQSVAGLGSLASAYALSKRA